MKLLFTLLLTLNVLNASMLFDYWTPICIEDYYVKNGSLYYLVSSTNIWKSTGSNNQVKNIYYGYDFNATTLKCSPAPYKKALGLSYFDYHALLAFAGLIFSSILFYIITSFLAGL